MKKIKFMAEFHVGQRVRLTDHGAKQFQRRGNATPYGVVKSIQDLSHAIKQDNPGRTRNFSLRVMMENHTNKNSFLDGNGVYFEPA